MDSCYFDVHLVIVSGHSVIFVVLIVVLVIDVEYDILTVLLCISNHQMPFHIVEMH
jgi:hypothetical protein